MPPPSLTLARLVARNLRTRILQSLLVVLGVGVALGTGITSIGFAESVSKSVAAGIVVRDIDLLILQANKPNPVTSRLDTSALDAVAALPDVHEAQPLLLDFVTLNENQIVLVYGLPTKDSRLRKRVDGRMLPLERGDVLIGKAAAVLGGIAVRDRIDLNLRSFSVAGLFESKSFMESGALYMRLDDLQELTGTPHHVNFLLLKVSGPLDKKRLALFRDAITAAVPEGRVLTAEEFLGEDKSLQVVRSLARIIFGTTALLGVLLISTIMLLTVSERRRDIAILRAIGWSPLRISGLLVMETMVLAITGAGSGLVLGMVGLHLALTSIRNVGIYAQSWITPSILGFSALAALAVAVLGAAAPVYHALRVRVAEEVKYS